MSNCPLSADGVHRGMKCACGSEMIIPRFCVSIEVIDHSETLVSEGFNCDDLRVAGDALRRAADKLERMQRNGELEMR